MSHFLWPEQFLFHFLVSRHETICSCFRVKEHFISSCATHGIVGGWEFASRRMFRTSHSHTAHPSGPASATLLNWRSEWRGCVVFGPRRPAPLTGVCAVTFTSDIELFSRTLISSSRTSATVTTTTDPRGWVLFQNRSHEEWQAELTFPGHRSMINKF
jgi:hypothetical protein